MSAPLLPLAPRAFPNPWATAVRKGWGDRGRGGGGGTCIENCVSAYSLENALHKRAERLPLILSFLSFFHSFFLSSFFFSFFCLSLFFLAPFVCYFLSLILSLYLFFYYSFKSLSSFSLFLFIYASFGKPGKVLF